MPNSKIPNVTEQELDNLLNQAFLNLDFTNSKNERIMETISKQILPVQAVNTSFIYNTFFIKLIAFIAMVATTVIVYVSYFKKDPHPQATQHTSANAVNTIDTDTTLQAIKKQETNIMKENTAVVQKENRMNVLNPIVKQEPTLNESAKHQFPPLSSWEEEKKEKVDDTSYVFPKLTEKEIKATIKQKEKMANWLLKGKDKYALIAGRGSSSIFSNIDDTTAMFCMQNAEVTNLEYRTFLFDLLIHNEKKLFLKSKPHQYLWLSSPADATASMKEFYFSDKRYNDYPVVNITVEGAELYCKWLNSIAGDKITARLPYENEWIKASKGNNNSAVYPWPGDSIQNKYGCYLSNFCIKKQSDKLKHDINIKCIAKNVDAHSSAQYMIGDSMMTCKVYSYNPNDFGLYCMAGNVAELVYTNGKSKVVITKGGSWNSDFEHCKNYQKEELDKIEANVMVGFRPLFRINQAYFFGSKQRENQETGLPIISIDEKALALKEKKKMIDELVKFNKDKYAYIPMGSFTYKKDTFSVQAFYMQTTEVTNLQYRTFLMDLLVQNRTDDYLMAKPDQKMWMQRFPNASNEPMTNLYFSHPAYDDYPVVNISRKAALLYCYWLTVETNVVLKANNKPLINDLRIPADIEWACAAKQYDTIAKYANGHKFLRDRKGKYEANFMCYTKEECRYDSTFKLYVPKVYKQQYTEDGLFHTGNVKSYTPNNFGLHCMAGNVAEMVYTYDKKTKTNLKSGTKGGSWFSCDHFLEIDAEEEFPNESGPSPLIGFRPVITAVLIK